MIIMFVLVLVVILSCLNLGHVETNLQVDAVKKSSVSHVIQTCVCVFFVF